MYHEEKVINGVLCHKSTPDGPWEPFTPKALTTALIAERSNSKKLSSLLENANDKLQDIRNAVGYE